ncbi:MAG: N-acetylneuraminate synthase family protein [Candidatus Paceibacterota bacterium]|jgi:sialic acid synthase SpsE
METPLAIFEIGINHLGDKARALRMVDTLIAQGATHLTIQALVDPLAYSRDATGAKMLQSNCLSFEDNVAVVSHARAAGAHVGVAILDPIHVRPFVDAGASFFKVLSSDITYTPLHLAVADTKAPLYLSTAASTPDEMIKAVALIRSPYPEADVRLIHTVFPIPTPAAQLNLSAIPFLIEKVGVPVAYGQHAAAREALPAAIAAGAESVFVYVAEEFSPKLIDGPHAILCSEAGNVLEMLAQTRAMMGTYDRVMGEQEQSWRAKIRRSVVAARAIVRGETITQEMVRYKRPGTGTPAWDISRVVGSVAKREYLPDEDIT